MNELYFGNCTITKYINNLGVCFDQHVHYQEYMKKTKLCQITYFHLRNICEIGDLSDEKSSQVYLLVQALTSSRLDYCISPFVLHRVGHNIKQSPMTPQVSHCNTSTDRSLRSLKSIRLKRIITKTKFSSVPFDFVPLSVRK